MTQTPYNLTDFARFARGLTLDTGAPFRVQPFQRQMLRDYFDGVIETVIIVPKKNGKTTLLGALALYHLIRWPEAECVIAASSRDQARILFKQAAGLVRRSQMTDTFDVRSGYGEIRLAGQKDGPRIRVLAADSNTADGVIPTLALVDELHRHPSGELYGIFRDGLGPRNGRMLTISTAGANLDSPLGILRQRAHLLPGFTRDEEHKRNYAFDAAGSFALHEWCLGPEDDVNDMAVVKKANPASWQTRAVLQRRHDSPSTTPWQWMRFACGIWTEGEEPWIAPEAWDVLADPELVIDGEPVWLGVDIGVRHDTTGIAIVAAHGDQVDVQAEILAPGASGVPLTQVEQRLRELCEEHEVLGIAFDPWSFRRSAEMLEAEGLPMLEFPQSPERMSQASASLFRLIESGDLHHDGDPALRAQVLAGVTKETERGWRLQKDPRSRRPIDALIALAMASHLAISQPASEPLVVWA